LIFIEKDTPLSKEEIDDNSMRLFLDDTVELDDLVKEIKKDE
jgi:hypothetical protein